MSILIEPPKGQSHNTIGNNKFVLRHCLFENKPWPSETDIACWHCTESFDTQPVPLPVEYNPLTKIYVGHGVFCSLSCVKGYILNNTTYNTPSALVLLRQMAVEVFGVTSTIWTAPPFCILTKFGGTLSIKEFRKLSTKTHMMVKPDLFVTRAMILVSSSSDTPEWSIEAVHGSPPNESEQVVVPKKSLFDEYVKTKTKGANETKSVTSASSSLTGLGKRETKSVLLQQSLLMHMT